MKSALLALPLVALATPRAHAGGQQPEDLLKGKIIISDQRLPMRWSSVASYVAQLKGLNKGTLWYDKKTGKVRIEFAAFLAKPLNDVQVDLAIYDVTNGASDQRNVTEQFMNRGDRVLFNSVVFDKEDYPMNKVYRLVVRSRGSVLAAGQFILRGATEQYSGKVTFSEEETRRNE